MTLPLRLNQGDASEARIYYCAHFVARSLGLFEANGVEVAFTSTETGGRTILGGQIPAVLSGAADLTIGGPMVAMKMVEDGGPRLHSFCAAVAANPWVLASAEPEPNFSLQDLKQATIVDIGNVGTATLCFRWLLRRLDVSAEAVTLMRGSGDEATDVAAVASRRIDYALHSMHALAPHVAAGNLHVVASLAEPTGPVPWSAYIAQPEVLAARPADFEGFTRAIAAALNWIQRTPPDEVAASVAGAYPGYSRDALSRAIHLYQQAGVFARTPVIGRSEFDHFALILRDMGWLSSAASYADLVDTWFAVAAQAAERSSIPGGL
jgi:NitT/TauT family transport system substrate-binding protein